MQFNGRYEKPTENRLRRDATNTHGRYANVSICTPIYPVIAGFECIYYRGSRHGVWKEKKIRSEAPARHAFDFLPLFRGKQIIIIQIS